MRLHNNIMMKLMPIRRSVLLSAALPVAAALLASFFYVTGCGSSVQLPVADDAHVARASQRWPGTTSADLAQGRNAYRERCSGCHGLYAPDELTEAEWNKVLPAMHRKAHSGDREREWIDKYVRVHAKNSGVERTSVR